MFAKRLAVTITLFLTAWLGFTPLAAPAQTGDKKTEKKGEKKKEVWTDASDPTLPVDFKYQGEYVGVSKERGKLGCQVIALGNGAFQAVILPGGLPGAGWDGKDKIIMAGKVEGDKAILRHAEGKRKYLAQSPDEFSATAKFPPASQDRYSPGLYAEITPGNFGLWIEKEKSELKKITRKGDTLGAKPPEGAVVLFDGASKDEWNGGRVDRATGFLNTDGNDITTKRKFNNYTAHVEFLIPFKPAARDQGRGNSGFYQVDQYEVQILDSFGLEGKNNECGGVYTRLAPKINSKPLRSEKRKST